jgi:hypothetical protein
MPFWASVVSQAPDVQTFTWQGLVGSGQSAVSQHSWQILLPGEPQQ